MGAAGWGGWARGCSGGWGFCEEFAEGRWCVQAMTSKQLGQRRWRMAGTESRKDAAATNVAEPRKYAACIGGQLRCERVLANVGDALMMLRVLGWGGSGAGL